MNETWRDIPGWEPFYEVSDCGLVRSKDRVTGGPFGTSRTVKGRVLAQAIVKGYPQVNLKNRDRKECHYVHRLVLISFRGPPQPDQQGCHNDGNRKNNTLENLRWDTLAANKLDMIRHGTSTKGERNPMAKMSAKKVKALRMERDLTGTAYAALGKKYGISESNAHAICTGALWLGQEETQ